ncbi:uncharacterized protein [Macrobrachium rosenbergii]|uniref:uncharacterized protein isoform X2 n=1 Tax=Macrobrachium rosenbergii TaxID=79674 RepID=UPI0034D58906
MRYKDLYVKMASKLECSLQKWALDLSQRHKLFSHSHQLTPEHFSNLTKDEKLQPILTYLIRHVRPPEEQRQVKLNLKHAELRKKLIAGESEASPSEERFKLQAAIIDARTMVSSEAKEIQQLSQKKEEYQHQEVDFTRRLMLLKIVEKEREKEIQRCNSWDTQLKLLYDSLHTKRSKTSSGIDSDAMRALQSNLISIASLRHSINSGQLVSQDCIHKEKIQVWDEIRETVEEWGPRSLMLCLLGEVREGNRNLQSLIQRVDLARDAYELRLKCEKDGSFIDEMNPGGVIESVSELLGQMSAAHVKLYVEAHHINEAVASITRALNTLMNNIAAVAKRTYEDENVASSLVELIKENISLVGERAALNMTHTIIASLRERAKVAERARDVIRTKYAKIVSFNKEVKLGVESIHCLAISVKDGKLNVNNQIESVRSDVSDVLEAMVYPTPVLSDVLKNECLAFASVPLGYLLTTDVDQYGMLPKVKMTTTPMLWFDKSQVDAGSEALTTLGSSLLSWDGVYKKVVETVNHITSLKKQMEQLLSLKEAASSSQKKGKVITRQDVKELVERAKTNDEELEEELTRVTDLYEKKISEGSQHLTRVNKLLTEWWEQPAKKVIIKKSA